MSGARHSRNRHLVWMQVIAGLILIATSLSDATSAKSSSPVPVIGVHGTDLTYNGHVIAITGFDAYGLATFWGDNRGCGGEFSTGQLNALFSTIAPHSLVRFDAFQGGLGVNPSTGLIDFAGIDRVFAAAEKHHIELAPVLASQWGGCDDGAYKDLGWYQGGWRHVADPSIAAESQLPAPVVSYKDWVRAVVSRYASSPALGMWEPIGEPEAGTCPHQDLSDDCVGDVSCPSEDVAAQALRSFFDHVGAEIRSIDPRHLIESGLLSGDQCGVKGRHFNSVIASPGIDVASFHDFLPHLGLGGPPGSTVLDRITAAHELDKPIIDAETGIAALSKSLGGNMPGCLTLMNRSSLLFGQARLQFEQGVAGVMLWNVEPNPITACTLGLQLNDAILSTFAPRLFNAVLATTAS